MPDAASLCHERIVAQVEQVVQSQLFSNWKSSEAPAFGDLVIFNNSVIYRDSAPTNKSLQYLAYSTPKGPGSLGELQVVYGMSTNSSFKRVAAGRAQTAITTLAINEAIEAALKTVGSIVFALVGEFAQDEPAMIQVSGINGLRELRYDQTIKASAEFENGALTIKSISDCDSSWRAAAAVLSESTVEKLAPKFEETFRDLQNAAPQPVSLTVPERGKANILGAAEKQMKKQLAEYLASVRRYAQDPTDLDAYNNILRLSYSFADGTLSLVPLFVGLSDLKPILFWMTIGHQHALASAFNELPFGITGTRKPSLKSYRDMIAGARNHSFHDFFAFQRPLRFDLTGVPIAGRALTVFREFGRNFSAPAFDYEDRELFELLQRFTRTPERRVPVAFWERNGEVMSALLDLTCSFEESLRLLANASSV